MLVIAISLAVFAFAIFYATIVSIRKNAATVPAAFLNSYETTLFIFVVMSLLFVGITISKFVSKMESHEVGVYISTVVLQVLFSIAILCLSRKIGINIRIGNVVKAIKNGVYFFLSTISVLACGGVISIIYKMIFGEDIAKQLAVEMFIDIDILWLKILAIFSIVILAPVAEEIFFRGFLYPATKGWVSMLFGIEKNSDARENKFKKRVSLATSAIIVSVLFSLIHSSLFAALPIFIMSIILICAYEKTNSILAPIVTHSLFNFANVSIILLSLQ